MPFIITDPCIETKDTACVDVCPVDCIHPRKDEPEFAQATMLYIHPEECIDCGACVPACPVAAIYESIDATPSHQKDLIEANAVYRNGDPALMAQAEEIVKAHVAAQPALMAIPAAEQIPTALFGLEGYWSYWHGGKGYSGVALHVSQAFAPERPVFAHPDFDYETRIVTAEIGDLLVASIYVPNGGKDFPAKMQFLEALDAYAASLQGSGRHVALMGDMNVARTERDVHPRERKPRAI